ncbi:Peptidoglycan/LPS O-acetylase OafA/YrhL, contains acyltransferase and SGNH-hydrolase domains [Chitinophaga jiangningensis]|uniref:Peptidoglycan/LPS O-acetylase OafA/YrhL, contains acyltransferase and SGNH-hydrolase domains n=1 Tax=Chitinophaga jiangningensis TaxID=1419482 RepID=A0A1M7LMS1_9BACT|nr:acyltransferase [Chitinophaga jiangningensis]SHM79534.1 Peptidoglycan/LPS O-acetylase OafA/YrhL, contains acyltransferase and SGNH-hydrolase domains [Chitinophaga jiangningensis]
MSPVSLLPMLLILLLILLWITLVSNWLQVRPQEGRYKSIDGLRGYLAVYVFLYHAIIWFFFLRSNKWTSPPPSVIHANLGAICISLFFMITAFLFFSKLVHARERKVDWVRLYISRILRIYPVYTAVVIALLFVVGILTHWKLREPLPQLVAHVGQWMISIAADVNHISGTKLIIAGVVWSLAFEWLYYAALPFLGLLLGVRAPFYIYLMAAVFLALFIGIIYYWYPANAWNKTLAFTGGMIPAFFAAHPKVRQLAAHWITSLLMIAVLIIATLYSPYIYSFFTYLCTTFIFVAIACGNTLFGILTWRPSCLLGQIAFSLYIIHGLILFITFMFILGMPVARVQSPLVHWLITAGCSLVLVTVCTLSYKYLERPFLEATPSLTARVKRYFRL